MSESEVKKEKGLPEIKDGFVEIRGEKFEVVSVTKKIRRGFKQKYGLNLIKEITKIMDSVAENSSELPIELMDDFFDFVYPKDEERLDKIGVMGQATLFMLIIQETLKSEENQEKN